MSEIKLDEIEACALRPSREALESARAEHENAIADLDAQAKLNQERVDRAAELLATIQAEHDRILKLVLERRGLKASTARVDGDRLVLDEPEK